MNRWTPELIPNQSGRVAVVTGANSGLGFETALELARHGARVIMACRDDRKCDTAVQRIADLGASGTVVPYMLDLADLESVRSFVAGLSANHDRVDLLINNAGVMAPPHRAVTAQGFELQLGTNHLGHFALTGLLLPLMREVPGSRVVTVSSFAHEIGRMDFDDLQHERDYTPYGAYGQSKLANLLFMRELDVRLRAAGAKTISVGAHPGFASTNLQAAGPFLGSSPVQSRVVLAGVRVVGQSAARGALPQLFAATADGVHGGDYFGPRFKVMGSPVPSTMTPAARNDADARRLWEVSVELTGVDPEAQLS